MAGKNPGSCRGTGQNEWNKIEIITGSKKCRGGNLTP